MGRFIFVAVMEKNGRVDLGYSGMISRKEVGEWGEMHACDWLRRQGVEILHRNWRSGHKEIDVIGRFGDVLIFVEVKCRSTSLFAPPESAVNGKKWKNLGAAATDFMRKNKYFGKFRFDVLAVTITPYCKQIMHFKDAFCHSKATVF